MKCRTLFRVYLHEYRRVLVSAAPVVVFEFSHEGGLVLSRHRHHHRIKLAQDYGYGSR